MPDTTPGPPSRDRLTPRVQSARGSFGARPPDAAIVKPGRGQESVWDFPRPPRVEDVPLPVRVEFGGEVIAQTTRAIRIVETAGAPCYYIAPDDCRSTALRASDRWTVCEWKGAAIAYDVVVSDRTAINGAWSYVDPLIDLGMHYERIAGWFAFYASKMDACYVGDERVHPQPGGFYGGWMLSNLTGPVKGEPGSESW